MAETHYHRFLRVTAVVLALVLVFQSGLLADSTALVANNTQQYLANAIGMSASIQPTELNQLTAELTVQRRALEAREVALREREIAVELTANSQSNQRTTYLLASLLLVMLILIILNYILDFRRSRESSFLGGGTQTV